MDPEFSDLVPLFVAESRDRIERFAGCVPRLAQDAQAAVEARRELHTLKGAGRMMRLGRFAELCHAAEEVLQGVRPGAPAGSGMVPLLTRVADRLSAMVERIDEGSGEEPPAAGAGTADLLALLAAAAPGPHGAAPVGRTGPDAERAAEAGPAAALAGGAVAGQAGKMEAAGREIRVEAQVLDAVAERSTEVRIMALAARQVVERIQELALLAEKGAREPRPAQVLAVLSTMMRRVAADLEGGQLRLVRAAEAQLEEMLALQLQPLRGSLRALARYARELGRSLEREVEVELAGEETRLDRRIAREIEEALLHLVRNAVDHGIEAPRLREARGKARAGRLQLLAFAEGSRVRLVIADDGDGIDPESVLRQAIQSGVVDAAGAAGLGKDEILRLVLAPGFSTRQKVSEVSGRGMGLDVVAAAVGRVGGEVFLASEPGRGTTVTLEVPLARRGEHVLLLRVGQLRLALPSAVVRRATRLDQAAVVERDGRTLALLGDRLVSFVPLARLYGQPAAPGQLLLEGVASGQPLALAVDEVEGEQEILVRPLTHAAATDRLLEGVSLLASGEPVGVLSPAMLARREYLRTPPPAASDRLPARRSRVLLVDDSLVTREMERRLLEDAGFEVAAAADASEALSRLGEGAFDCLVTDIEMEGMDGLELTSQLRSMEHFLHLPIVVVSTREGPEDRLRGLKAGADAYLTKQSLDAGELIDLVRRLSGRQ